MLNIIKQNTFICILFITVFMWLLRLIYCKLILYKWYFEWFPPNQEDLGYYSDWYDGFHYGFSLKLFSISWHIK